MVSSIDNCPINPHDPIPAPAEVEVVLSRHTPIGPSIKLLIIVVSKSISKSSWSGIV